MPLLACLSVEELAGVIAGQMALVRRHAACRMTNIIRSINGWLWQSVYGSSRFDQWLRRMAQRPRFHAGKLLVPLLLARFPVQIVLFVPMFLANTLASGIARRAELDADLIAAQLTGRNSFAHLVQRLGMIDFAWQGILVELDFLYRDQQLPDSLPQQLAVLGTDNDPFFCEGGRTLLSSIDVNHRKIGFLVSPLICAKTEIMPPQFFAGVSMKAQRQQGFPAALFHLGSDEQPVSVDHRRTGPPTR